MDVQTQGGPARAEDTGPAANVSEALRQGATAPDFELLATPDQKITLGDFAGKPLILAFYPADWSPVCSDQMALYNEILPEFSGLVPSCSASRSMACGATSLSQRTGSFTSLFLRILSPREPSLAPIARTGRRTASASAPCL